MKLATPEFQTEYCTWARPLKTGMCLCRRLLTHFHECQSQCVCVRACECVCGLACFWELYNDKGWGECDKCFSFCLLVRSMCYLTLPLPAQQNAHTRAQGHPRCAQKAFSLQLIAALHSPVVKLFTALWPHSTRTHTDLCTHTHACARVFHRSVYVPDCCSSVVDGWGGACKDSGICLRAPALSQVMFHSLLFVAVSKLSLTSEYACH